MVNGQLRWVGRWLAVGSRCGFARRSQVANRDAVGGGWPVMHRGGRISGHAQDLVVGIGHFVYARGMKGDTRARSRRGLAG